jgi:hypothetical protein
MPVTECWTLIERAGQAQEDAAASWAKYDVTCNPGTERQAADRAKTRPDVFLASATRLIKMINTAGATRETEALVEQLGPNADAVLTAMNINAAYQGRQSEDALDEAVAVADAAHLKLMAALGLMAVFCAVIG